MTTKKAAPAAAPTPVAEGETIVVSEEEKQLLTNARALREAAAAKPEPAPEPQQVVQIDDERAQRELDLRVINEQLMYARQALAAGKVNRLLNQKGMLAPEAKQHDAKWVAEIREARKGVDYLIEVRNTVGEHGLPEPSGLEVATPADVPQLVNA